MTKTFLVAALSATLLIGCGTEQAAEHAPPASPADSPQVDTTVRPEPATPPDTSGSTALGIDLASLVEAVLSGNAEQAVSRLKTPQRLEEEPQQNRHQPSQTDTIRTYHYDGVVVETYDVTGGDVLVQRVEVTAPPYRTAEGVGVGSRRQAVLHAMGQPDSRENGTLVYQLSEQAPQTLRVRLDDDRVSGLQWHFYVD